MSSDDVTRAAADAAIAVMNALQPLTQEERARVIQSAAALFGVSPSVAQTSPSASVTPHFPSHDRVERVSGKRMSLVELLQDRGAVTNAQRIACFAYYREKIEGQENFSSADLAVYFPQAKLPKPGTNYARDYKKAVTAGWIHDDGAKSYLTQTGESAVDAGFAGKAAPRGAAAAKRRKKAKSE